VAEYTQRNGLREPKSQYGELSKRNGMCCNILKKTAHINQKLKAENTRPNGGAKGDNLKSINKSYFASRRLQLKIHLQKLFRQQEATTQNPFSKAISPTMSTIKMTISMI